jgi:L-fuconolactonase
MNRREFLAAAGAGTIEAQQPPIPIVDTHIHLFDTNRKEGVPWPQKTNAVLYKPALPARYREVVKGMNIVAAIEVEASPWLEDNQWVLDVIAKDNLMVGTVGNLDLADKDFEKHLDRFRANPLFLGIRYGNLWNRDPGEHLDKPLFRANLKALARAGLTLDTANPRQKLLGEFVRIADLAPDLRIVIDHLPNMPAPQGEAEAKQYKALLKEFGQRKKVYVKISEVLQRRGDAVNYSLAAYKEKLDEIYGAFGEDHVLYGSDWPNSDPLGTYRQVLGIVKEYFASKPRAAAEKYFWKNSIAAYRWKAREAGQQRLNRSA